MSGQTSPAATAPRACWQMVGCGLSFLASAALWGCVSASLGESASSESVQRNIVELRKDSGGSLVYCDEQGECEEVPNPSGCARLIIEIDVTTGGSCERCESDDGQVIYESCGGPAVTCTEIAVPEPDCLLCVYLDDSIVFSSCPVSEPFCGDDHCHTDESCTSCPQDCGECVGACGDGVCDPNESCVSCAEDCGECPPSEECGNGICEPGETCGSCPADCGACPTGSGRLKYYGVDMAQTSDFPGLASRGVNIALVALGTSWTEWHSFLTAAEQNGMGLVIWPLGGCQGSASVPWCPVGQLGWDLSAGEDALRQANQYVLDGGTALVGVVSTHEPFWSAGLTDPVNQMRTLYDAMKAVAPQVKVFTYVNRLAGFADSYDMTTRMFDIAGVWRHCFGGAEGTCAQAIQDIRNDRQFIIDHNLDVELFFSVQTFAMAGSAYQMPSYDELKDFTCQIVQEDLLDGLWYYTWRNPAGYSDVLMSRADLHPVIDEVIQNCQPNP